MQFTDENVLGAWWQIHWGLEMRHMRQILITIAIIALSRISIPIAEAAQITVPAVDGMIINTEPDALQHVKIRLKSFGPGFCQVRVILAGQVHSLAAPPAKWSSWYPIGPAVSGGAYSLNFSPQCGTGALGEIRYHKN